VIEGVLRAPAVTGIAHYAVSNNGVLLYAPGTTLRNLGQRSVVIADEAGVISSPPLPPGAYETPRVSFDGKQLAFGNEDRDASGIWVYELAGTTALRRLTFDNASSYPLWTRDSQRVTYQSRSGNGGIYWQRADGGGIPEQLTKAEAGISHVPESWSPDGNVLLYSRVEGSRATLWMLDRRTGTSAPFENVESASPLSAVFSPDGRWVAYATRTTSSQSIVYVQPFPPSPVKYQISRNDDGHHPLWSPDGKRLYYIPAPGAFLYVPIETSPVFKFGAPQPVTRMFSIGNAPTEVRGNDVTPDGRRFVGLALAQGEGGDRLGAPSPTLRVVINWFEDLKQRASIK
jgi:Tol biopolymer transport system component